MLVYCGTVFNKCLFELDKFFISQCRASGFKISFSLLDVFHAMAMKANPVSAMLKIVLEKVNCILQ